MGNCCQSQQQHIASVLLIEQAIIKIILKAQQQQLKRQKQFQIQQNLLMQQFNSNVAQRSQMTEKIMINQTVYNQNYIHIYKYIEHVAMIIKDKKGTYQHQDNFNAILPPINVLVYCSTFMKDPQLINFAQVIKQKFSNYQQPTDSDINIQLIKFHKHNDQATFEMENTLIMQICHRHTIGLEKINAVGHKYGYGLGTIIHPGI